MSTEDENKSGGEYEPDTDAVITEETSDSESVLLESPYPVGQASTDFSDEEETPAAMPKPADEEESVEHSNELPALDLIENKPAAHVTLVANPIEYDAQYRELYENEVGIELPSIKTNAASAKRHREVDEKYADVDEADVPEGKISTHAQQQRSRRLYHADDLFDPLLNDSENDIQQGVIGRDGKRYGASTPKVKLPVKGQVISGSAAMAHMSRSLGVGTSIANTLWSCGISINIRPLLAIEHNALDNAMAMVKRDKGWATSGLTYSAGNSVVLVAFLKELKQYITTCNYHTADPDELYDIIDVSDIQGLIGIAGGTMFPNGVRFERPCSNTMACDHVASGRLLPDRVRIELTNKLTMEQRHHGAFSSTGSRKFSYEEVLKYKSSHAYRGKDDVLRLTAENGMEIVYNLKVPSINQFIDDTDVWTSRIIETTTASLGEEVEDGEREKFLRRAAKTSTCSQYLSWIDSIEINDATINKREDIIVNLELIQQDTELVAGFIAGVRKFIRAATISVVAIPAYTCKACKSKNKEDLDEATHPSMIAIDALDLFFQLGTLQRMRSISNIAKI